MRVRGPHLKTPASVISLLDWRYWASALFAAVTFCRRCARLPLPESRVWPRPPPVPPLSASFGGAFLSDDSVSSMPGTVTGRGGRVTSGADHIRIRGFERPLSPSSAVPWRTSKPVRSVRDAYVGIGMFSVEFGRREPSRFGHGLTRRACGILPIPFRRGKQKFATGGGGLRLEPGRDWQYRIRTCVWCVWLCPNRPVRRPSRNESIRSTPCWPVLP